MSTDRNVNVHMCYTNEGLSCLQMCCIVSMLLLKVNVVCFPSQAQCFAVKCALQRYKCLIILATAFNAKQ